MNIFDSRYDVSNWHQIKELVIWEFDNYHLNIRNDLDKIPEKVSFTANM